jgi:hypothetical protein
MGVEVSCRPQEQLRPGGIAQGVVIRKFTYKLPQNDELGDGYDEGKDGDANNDYMNI